MAVARPRRCFQDECCGAKGSGEALTKPEQAHIVALERIRPIESKLHEVHKAEDGSALGRATKKGCPDTSQGKTLVT